MSRLYTKRIILLWIGSTFLILGGVAFAVMGFVDPGSRTSTQIQTVVIEEVESLPLPDTAVAPTLTGDVTESTPTPALMPSEALRAALLEVDQPYWEVIDRSNLGLATEGWQTVLIQNRLKIDYTVVPEYARDWEWVRDGRKIQVQFHAEIDAMQDILSRKKIGKYAVQMVSLPASDFSKALRLQQLLMADGHYAYLQRSEEQYAEQTWYRVRVGFFQDAEEAQLIGQEIFDKYSKSGEFSQDYWAVLPTSRELSRSLVDLQQPITKPWVIELPLQDSFAAAMEILPKFVERSDFSYLSQHFDPETQKMQFRIRVGFYETTGEARSSMYGLRNQYDGFRNARIVKL